MATALRKGFFDVSSLCLPTAALAIEKKKTERLPKKSGSRLVFNPIQKVYCVGRSICVKPTVTTVRSIGVSGGSKLGVRKFVSN